MEQKTLMKCGLSEGEAKVYLALIKLHTAQAGRISQKSGVHRRTIYLIIDNLIKDGLVRKVKKEGKTYYEAMHPQNLLALVQQKKYNLNNILPQLCATYEDTKDTQIINFFKGKEGVKTILDDIILKGQEVLVIGAVTVPPKFVDAFRRYRKRRVGKNIRSKLLFTESQRGEFQHIHLDKVRFLPNEYRNIATTAIYANKIGILLFTKDPVGISIKVPEIIESYRNYFNLLWKIAKE